MPPFVPKRKAPADEDRQGARDRSSKKVKSSGKGGSLNPESGKLKENETFLEELGNDETSGSESDEFEEDGEFEDALAQPQIAKRASNQDEEIDWQDAIERDDGKEEQRGGAEISNLEITLEKHAQERSLPKQNGKPKGPTKIERQIRMSVHRMHVQCLLFHNLIRNGWICDQSLQEILVAQLPKNVAKEIDLFRRMSKHPKPNGLHKSERHHVKSPTRRESKRQSAVANPQGNGANHRDWGTPAVEQDSADPDLSRGDPVLRLVRYLAVYWKKHFKITAPGLRKQGYKPISIVEEEIASYRTAKDRPHLQNENICNLEELRERARAGNGSRDVGSQLFTALIRGIGIEARLVASLQPLGFGWTKYEDAAAPVSNIASPQNDSPESSSSDLSEPPTDSDTELSDPSKSVGSRDIIIESSRLRRRSDAVRQKHASPQVHAKEKRQQRDSKISVTSKRNSAGDPSLTHSTPDNKTSSTRVQALKSQSHDGRMNGRPRAYDSDMTFPVYWTEVISPNTNLVYPIECFILNPQVTNRPEHCTLFEAKGKKAEEARLVFAYVIAYSSDGTAKDVTARYLKGHRWPSRMKNVRIPEEMVRTYDRRGRILGARKYDWVRHVLSAYRRPPELRDAVDHLEDDNDLKIVVDPPKINPVKPDTLQGLKSSAEFVLKRHLRREEALRPNAKPVKFFAVGKGDDSAKEPVFLRSSIEICRTAESWHKEGREVKPGEVPLKEVPVRAVTMTRKREVEEAERDGGKLMQGMYAYDQTDWIVPEPIKNGVIPKNAYGNMDCFVPSMVPKGAVHLPLRSVVRVCKKLEIDYAEAVTGFEFGKRMAIPVISGVVIAAENEAAVRKQWKKEEEERRIREEGKREKAALALWRKWMAGLRIIKRMREDHDIDNLSHLKEERNPFTNKRASAKDDVPTPTQTAPGGFVTEDADYRDHGSHVQWTTKAPVDDDLYVSEASGGVMSPHDQGALDGFASEPRENFEKGAKKKKSRASQSRSKLSNSPVKVSKVRQTRGRARRGG